MTRNDASDGKVTNPGRSHSVSSVGMRVGQSCQELAGSQCPRWTSGFFYSFWGILLLLLCHKVKVSRMISSYPILQGLKPVDQVRGGRMSEDSAVLRSPGPSVREGSTQSQDNGVIS